MGITAAVSSMLVYQDLQRGQREASAAASTASDVAEADTMQGYWETYQQWGADAAASLEQNVSGMTARMAASGVQAGSEQWVTNLDLIQSEYESDIQALEGGATGTLMADWAERQQLAEQRTTYDVQYADVDEYEADIPTFVEGPTVGFEEYLGGRFGALEVPTRPEAITPQPRQITPGTGFAQPTQRTGIQAAAAQADKGTASPWW